MKNNKKLYYALESSEGNRVLYDLSGCMKWIEKDMSICKQDEGTNIDYTLTPLWLTDQEYNSLLHEVLAPQQ